MARVETAHKHWNAQLGTTTMNPQKSEDRGLILDVPDPTNQFKYLNLDDPMLVPRLVLRGPLAEAHNIRDVLTIGPLGSSNDTLSISFANGVILTRGCFTGTIDQFAEELQLKGSADPRRLEYEITLKYILEIAKLRGFT